MEELAVGQTLLRVDKWNANASAVQVRIAKLTPTQIVLEDGGRYNRSNLRGKGTTWQFSLYHAQDEIDHAAFMRRYSDALCKVDSDALRQQIIEFIDTWNRQ